MPTYEIQGPDGRTFEIQGDSMPSAPQLQSIFERMGGGPRQPARAEDFMEPEEDRGSAASRFAGGAWEMLNPLTIAEGVYNTVRHPIETGKALVGAQVEQFGRAGDAFRGGRYSEAAGHAGAGMLPVLGPVAANIGERAGEGDIAGAAGNLAGIVAPLGGARAVYQGVKRGAVGAIPARAATRLEKMAAERVAAVMSPKANTNVGRRMGNKAESIAPELAKDADITAHWSRSGMGQSVATKLDDATAMLDEASDARLSARTFDTKPIMDALRAKRAELSAHAVEGSRLVPSLEGKGGAVGMRTGRSPESGRFRREPATDAPVTRDISTGQMQSAPVKAARPIGKDVTPAPNRARAAQLDQAIKELQTLGPVARYDDLRLIRQAYDGPAKTVYNPSMTADFLAKKGEALGAADVTGTLRDALAKMDPETAAANAQYSLYRNASDILKAAEEIERVRPKVGRQIMARLTGTLFGGQQAGVPGAVAGYALGPVFDQLANAGFTTQLKSAQLFQSMATAIRKGDVGRVASQESQIRALLKRAGVSTAQATQAIAQPAYAGIGQTSPR